VEANVVLWSTNTWMLQGPIVSDFIRRLNANQRRHIKMLHVEAYPRTIYGKPGLWPSVMAKLGSLEEVHINLEIEELPPTLYDMTGESLI
jgi:hypothetical protein